MVSHKRKNHQRWFNQYCRHVNKIIEDDDLWLGRFCIEQLGTDMHWFEDGSGGIMRAKILMRDKKTNITRIRYYTGLDMDWSFWFDFNNFIIDDCKVWEEIPNPCENRIDYRKKVK
jgi:hypothetical protein